MNASVKLNGVQVTASNLPLPDSSTWFSWYYERTLDYSAGATVSSGYIVATTDVETVSALISASKELQGIELNSNFNEIQYFADANNLISGISSAFQQQDPFILADGFVESDNIYIQSDLEQAQAFGGAENQINGLDLSSSLGEIFAIVETETSVEILINGIESEISVGNVTASSVSEEPIQLSGNPRRYSVDQFKSATVKIAGIETKISINPVKAFGVVSIGAIATIQNVGAYLEVPTLVASGTQWISDEELILMMAA